MCRETCCMTHHQENTSRLQFSTTILNYATSIMLLQTWSLLNLVRCSTFLKIVKRWSRWSSRAEVQRWDTYPELTELRLVGYLTQWIWTPRSKSNMLTPQTTRWLANQRKLHTWWMGPSPFFVEYHELLNVFLQPFSSKQKAECHVQESSEKYF